MNLLKMYGSIKATPLQNKGRPVFVNKKINFLVCSDIKYKHALNAQKDSSP